MTAPETPQGSRVERGCSVTAVAFSGRRRSGVRLMSGPRRGFGLNATRTVVHVPYPHVSPDWTGRTLTCGVALQCSPSKDRIAQFPLHELSPRELGALSLVEGQVAAGWLAARLPGLLPELRRLLPDLELTDHDLAADDMLDRALELARSRREVVTHPLLGRLPLTAPARGGLAVAARRAYARMPWTSQRSDSYRVMSVPVGGDGGSRNTNLPPPSRPENEDIEIRADQRAGLPYPEWNLWTESFLRDHVAVLERTHPTRSRPVAPVSPDIRRWFEAHTHRAMRGGLEDGSDLDIDRYVGHYIDTLARSAAEPRVFRAMSAPRYCSTAVPRSASTAAGSFGWSCPAPMRCRGRWPCRGNGTDCSCSPATPATASRCAASRTSRITASSIRAASG